MEELSCPKCGSTRVNRGEMLMDYRLSPEAGSPKGFASHIFDAYLCAECGYVVEFYHKGTAVRTD